MYLTENGKYIKVKNPYLTENGKFVKLSKAWLTQNGKFVKLKSGGLVARRLVANTLYTSAYSDDGGQTWKTSSTSLVYPYDSATNGETIVVTVGSSGSSSNSVTMIYYTKDGKTLTAVASPQTVGGVMGTNFVSYIPELEKFYCIRQTTGLSNSNGLYESSDGMSWKLVGYPGLSLANSPIVYDEKNSVFLVATYTSDAHSCIKYGIKQDNGFTNWTIATSYSTFGDISCEIATHNGLSVSFCGSQNNVYPIYSVNGKTWTKASKCGMAYPWGAVIYADGKYVRVGDQFDGTGWYSIDGKTWTKAEGSVNVWRSNLQLIHDGKQFIAIDSSGITKCSSDGKSWVDFPRPFPSSASNVATISFLA